MTSTQQAQPCTCPTCQSTTPGQPCFGCGHIHGVASPEIPTEYGLSREEAHDLIWALVESGTDVAVVRVSVLGALSAEVATRGRPRADRVLGYGWALLTVEGIEHAISEGTY